MKSLGETESRSAGLLALRTVVDVYGGLGCFAEEFGSSHETLDTLGVMWMTARQSVSAPPDACFNLPRKGDSRSIGRGNMMVVFLSAPITVSVSR
jgi:hypothetical protein